MKHFLLSLVVLLFAALAVSAQETVSNPNDPRVNEDANACNEGGSMAGKCHVDFDGNGIVDDYEDAWAWNCGWFMIRYEAGMVSRNALPSNCLSLIPLDLRCLVANFGFGGGYFVEYNGIPNQPGNVTGYFGGCGHEALGVLTHSMLVIASSLQEATEICSQYGTIFSIFPVDYAYNLQSTGSDVPAWVYGCDFF